MRYKSDSRTSARRWQIVGDLMLKGVVLPLAWLVAWAALPAVFGVWAAAAAVYVLTLLTVSGLNTIRAGDAAAQRDIPASVQAILRPVVVTGLAALGYGFLIAVAVLIYTFRTSPAATN